MASRTKATPKRSKVEAANRKRRKETWKVVHKGSLEDFDASCSLEYWRGKSTEEKFQAVDELIREALVMRGEWKGEPRMLKSQVVIRRLKG